MAALNAIRGAWIISALGCLVLSACASGPHDNVIETRMDTAESRFETAQHPAPVRTSDPLQVSDSIWLGDKVMRMTQGMPLPSAWEGEKSVALRSDSPLTLSQIASIILSETRIPIRLTDGAGDDDASSSAAGAAAQPGGAPPGAQPSSGTSPSQGFVVSYEGPLSGLLSLTCSYFNVNWRYDGTSIVISRYISRSFAMDALPGAISVEAPSGASGEGAASSATVTPLATASIDIWDDIQRTLSNIIGTSGTVDISQSSGTVLVTTTTDRMERVSRYLSEENKRLSRQVAISIELYSVEVADESAYGLDLTAALSSINGMPSLALSGVTSGLTDPASVTINLVDPNELSGTNGVVQALSTLGKTTRVAQIPITTLNNRPANQRVAVDTAYVSSISSTSSGVDNVSTEAETSTITSGLAVSVLPRIMSDGRILLQYALAQGDLLNLESFPIGDNTVQLPEMQGVSFSQQVMMKSGGTLVLAGFDQSEVYNKGRGVGRPMTWLFGGSTSNNNTRKIMVIAITPREIVVSRSEAS